MRYQDKPFFAAQIFFHTFPCMHVQMIRWLIDQQKIIFPGKQHRKKYFCLLSMT